MTEKKITMVKAAGLVLVCLILFLYQFYAVMRAEKAANSKKEEQEKELAEKEIQESNKYRDGIYQGSGTGFGGEIIVEVEITEDKIVNISILSADKETPEYLQAAEKILDDVMENQSADVDVISGATFSSNGILDGVKNALEQAVS